MISKRPLAALPIASAIVFGISAAHAGAPVGFSSSLTGPYAWVGPPHLLGTELAIQDINAAGGLLGEEIELIVVDDACDPGQAVPAAQKLIAERVVVAFGATCSGAAIAAAGLYGKAGVLLMESAATNPKLTDEATSEVFRVVGRDDHQGTVAGDWLARNHADRRIAIINDDQSYGRRLAEEVKKQLNRRGVTEAMFKSYVPGRVDYSDLLDELRAAQIEVVYAGGYSPEIGLIVRQARSRNYELKVVSGDGLSTGEFWLLAGEGGEGTIFTSFADPSRDARGAGLLDRLPASERNYRAVYSYAAVQVWAQAVETAGTFASETVAEILRTQEFDSILGRLGFDDRGDVTGIETFEWFVWKEGAYVPFEE